MVIDFHTHVFPDKIAPSTLSLLEGRAHIKASSDGTMEGLLHSMKEEGVALSVVLPVVTSARQFDSILRFASRLKEQESLIPFGGIHPDAADGTETYKEQLNLIKREGFPGIKLHPDYQGTFFNDIRYKRIISYASELDLIISVHAGIDIGLPDTVHCTPRMSAEVLDELSPPKLVLAHFGGYGLWNDVETMLAGRQVFLDTSYTLGMIDPGQFLRIIRSHGADKILFATDSPWMGQEKSLSELNNLPLTEDEKHRITSRNAIRLLNLPF